MAFQTPTRELCFKCKGQCCGPLPLTIKDFQRLQKRRPLKEGYRFIRMSDGDMVIFTEERNCPYLVSGKCSIYEHRPKICREYGMSPKLPCGYLYPEAAKQMVEGK